MKRHTAKQAANKITTVLRENGHAALFAGGCVRDELLGRPPKDYDVATDAPPEAVVKLFRNTSQVGAKFGVVIVRWGGRQTEVATFRADGAYLDGRHPEQVTFSDAKADAERRDFTINGMFLDPQGGQVIDYVNGRIDLQDRLIRAIGDPDRRFAEDHLRMLRAVRFATQLGFAIEPTTAQAIRSHADQLPQISEERIRMELEQILGDPARGSGWTRNSLTTWCPASRGRWKNGAESSFAWRRFQKTAPGRCRWRFCFTTNRRLRPQRGASG